MMFDVSENIFLGPLDAVVMSFLVMSPLVVILLAMSFLAMSLRA
jgi:hypothetical protein